MKRILFLVACMFLSGISLSGCGTEQKVTEAAVAEDSENQELILAGIDLDADVLSAVTVFNETSNGIVITVKDYGDGSGVLSDDTLVKVCKDVMNGDIPDMYIMSSASIWPVDFLNSQSVFVDLYPFLDDDSTISRDDFFSTILKTAQKDDELCCFPVSYMLKGIWGLPEYCDGTRFPVDRVSELCQLYPENHMLFGVFSSMDLINMEVSQNLDSYVNWETRACDFASEEFINVLKAAGNLPGYRPTDRDETMDYAAGTYLLEGRQFFAPYTVSDFKAYIMMTESMEFNPYGGDMVSMTLTDSEVALDIQSSFAITGACSDPNAAWQFLRTFLELEYQQSLSTATSPALPVNIHAFTAETDRLLTENNGTKADFDGILELMESVKVDITSDVRIESILYEEATAYFSGKQTVEDAARMIQERVSAYLMEYEELS